MAIRSVTRSVRGAAIAVVAVLLGGTLAGVSAQDLARVDRGPRFLREVARGQPRVAMDLNATPVLYQRISLDDRQRTLGELLTAIAERSRLELIYSADLLPLNRPMRFRADSITVAAALTEVLLGAGVDVVFYSTRQAGLVKRGDDRSRHTGVLTGRITDTTGQRVAGAEVFLAETQWRTQADTGGRYTLDGIASGRYTLSVRRFGYAKHSQAITVQDNVTDTVDVVLTPVAARLQELVTTATGRQRRMDIANDVTTINADSVMQAAPIRSVTDLLENRVPGLTVQHTSGAPGDPSRLRLRGVSSPLRNNDPIVIVDGIRYYGQQSANRSVNLAASPRIGGTAVATDSVASSGINVAPSPLDYLDPNTIETIEVLKGPSAATLYGQDAANGVIVITTKKGRTGPAQWTASVEQGRTAIGGDYPDLTFRWGRLLSNNAAVNCPASGQYLGFPCRGDSVVAFQLLNDPALTVLDRGNRTALSLGVSGGSSALTYAVTGSYGNETGLIKLPDYEMNRYQSLLGVVAPDWMRRPQHLTQWGATSSIRARLGEKADVSLTANLSRTEQQKSSLQEQLGTLMSTYLDPATGTYFRQSAVLERGALFGPVATLVDGYYQRATASATQFTNGANFTWRPQSWLTFTSDAGLNIIQRSDALLIPRGPNVGSVIHPDTIGSASDGQGTSVVSTVNLRGNALHDLGRGFQFRFAMGVNYTGTTTNDVANGTRDLAPGSTLQGSTVQFVRRSKTSDATFGWYVDPSVGSSKLSINAGLRLDGGSSYGANVKGLELPKFPKLGFSYVVSEEPWFPFRDLFQSFRVRMSYGKASRQPGVTDRLRLYTSPAQVPLDGQSQTSVTLSTLGNTDVRPERSTEFEGGIDADFLDSRVTLSLTGYRKTTDDALLDVPVAPEIYGTGVSIVKNIGVTRNTGLEVDAGAQLLRGGPVTWSAQVQLSRNRNLVVSLAPGVEPFYAYANTDGISNSGLRIVPGYPLFGRWSKPITGYADANGDGVLQAAEVQLGDTAVYVGSSLPNYTADFNTTLSFWHNALTVNASFAYQDGLSQRNDVARELAVFSAGQQDPASSLAEQAGTLDLVNSFGSTISDYNWIQTVSTTRFSTLSVSYRVPGRVARLMHAQQLDIAVQGSNLALWTNYRGLDPNVNAFGNGNNVSDTGILPQPRTWQLRVHAAF